MVLCPPAAPRLRPSAAPMKVPEFPLLEEAELEPLELDAEEPKVESCVPQAPRLRPSAPPVDICAVPLLELPSLAEEVEPCQFDDSLDSFTLDEAAADDEEAVVFVSPEEYIFVAPKAFSPGSASTAASSARSTSAAIDRLHQEPLLKQLEAPASPPGAPRLRPAAPPVDIFLMPEFELPPVAEDTKMGTAEAEEEEEVVFMLQGFDDEVLERQTSERGSLSPSLFGSSPSDDNLLLQPEVSAEQKAAKKYGAMQMLGDVPPLLVRANSSCSTRVPSPRIDSSSFPSVGFMPDLLLA